MALKGDVFAEQLFENQIFALFFDTMLDKNCGVASNYKDGMPVTYSGSNITIGSGAVCIRGRLLEEDTGTTLNAGTETKYCKLVIEIDLDKTNTPSSFLQGAYKILTSTTGYPSLTQTDIVKNVAGVYQYELAQFKTGSSGITDFVDKRTFLDIDSIYTAINNATATLMNTLEGNANTLISDLQEEIAGVEDGSEFIMKSTIKSVEVNVEPTQSGGQYYVSARIYLPSGYTTNNTIVLKAELVENTGIVGDNMVVFPLQYSYLKEDNRTYIDCINIVATSETYKLKLTFMRV